MRPLISAVHGRRLRLLIAFAVLVTAGACTSSEPSADVTPAATPTEDEVTPTPTPTASSPGGGETQTPEDDAVQNALPPQALLIASERGVDLVTPDGRTQALVSIPAQRAFHDGAGGVVFQGIAPPQPTAPSPAIMWLPPDGSDAVTIVPDGAADQVTLQGAALVDGAPSAFFTVREGEEDPLQATQNLEVLPVRGGERRTVATVGQWESGAEPISFGDGTFALNAHAEATRWFSFMQADGARVDVPHNPVTEDDPCEGNEDCPSLVAIDEAGHRLAWVTNSDITIVELEDPGTEQTVSLPPVDNGVRLTGLALSGDTLVANRARQDADPGTQALPAWVYDLSDPGEAPAEGALAGYATVVGT